MNKPPKIGLIETQYFPTIAFFAYWVQYDKIIIEQHENYSKRSYRNRCHIAGANGLLRLSIPLVKGKNNQKNIKEVAISYDENWKAQHAMAIQSAYGKSPFYEFYKDDILALFDNQNTSLLEWNMDIINCLAALLGLDSDKLSYSTSFETKPAPSIYDLRNKISPRTNFSSEVIPTYHQVFIDKNAFSPNLSILDLLFCKGPESIIYLESFPIQIFHSSTEKG